MLNLIKADIYRLFRTRSYYAVGLILIGLVFLITFTYSFGDESAKQGMDLVHLVNGFFGGNGVVMVIGIGAATYICTDYSSGYIKNIASSITRKSNIVISKFIVLLIGTFLYFLMVVMALCIFGSLMITGLEIGNIPDVISYTAMTYFLYMVVVTLAVLASCFFKSSAASIITIVVITTSISLLYTAIQHFLGIDLSIYSPIMNMMYLVPENTEIWMRAFLSGFGFMIVYLATAIFVIEKRDIA